MATVMYSLLVTNCTVVHVAVLISIVLVYRRLFVGRRSSLDPLPYPDVRACSAKYVELRIRATYACDWLERSYS